MAAKWVMLIKRNGKRHFYHRRMGYNLIPVSDGVDINDQIAVDFNFSLLTVKYLRPEKASKAMIAAALTVKNVRSILRKAISRSFYRSKLIGCQFEIDLDFVVSMAIKQQYRCAVSNLAFDWPLSESSRANPFRPSIDRIDSLGGYTRLNIRLVLVAVNVGRSDFDDATYFHICRAVARTFQQRCKTLEPVQILPDK